MNKNDYFIGRIKRTIQVSKWFKESCGEYNRRSELASFRAYVREENHKKAYEILNKITTYFINAYNSNGMIRIGYILQKNINKYGRKRVVKHIAYGLTGEKLDLRKGND